MRHTEFEVSKSWKLMQDLANNFISEVESCKYFLNQIVFLNVLIQKQQSLTILLSTLIASIKSGKVLEI